jgi:hypothetical protein
MIPGIEDIVAGLIAGEYTQEQANAWLVQHAEGAANDRRDMFAALAMQGYVARGLLAHDAVAEAWAVADLMMEGRDA